MSQDYPLPENEAERLKVVRSLGLMNTPPEERFDRYTRFARQLFGVPFAFVSIVGEDTQWFKSSPGLEMKESPRAISFCTHTIVEDEMMVIEDALNDPRFEHNPLVVGEPYLRFYAGVKLNVEKDICVGTLCVADTKPRYPTELELSHLTELARLLEDEFRSHAQSTTDSLTGLSNRRGFAAIGSHALAMCDRHDKAITLMHIRLDGFREINQAHGREAGDQVLKDVAQILLQLYRHSDVVARVGANDFFVLLTGTGNDALARPKENLTRAIREENLNLPFELSYHVHAIQYSPEQHRDIEALMAAADTAAAPAQSASASN